MICNFCFFKRFGAAETPGARHRSFTMVAMENGPQASRGHGARPVEQTCVVQATERAHERGRDDALASPDDSAAHFASVTQRHACSINFGA